jgi:zinc transport system permease protein
MLDDFMIRATLAGVGVAIAAAPLGCFVVWRRMAYFGEATAHAAMLGVALSLALQISIFLGVLLVAAMMAWSVTQLSGRNYAMDTLLGVFAHSSLAVGLVVVSFLSGIRIDLMAYLFGDILAVSKADLLIIWGGVALVIAFISLRWASLLTTTINEELAHASGLNPKQEKLFLSLSLAITIAVAIKVVGVLLIVAMLIIPAATARSFSRTPETMAISTAIIGSISAVIGLRAAYIFDTPPGPSIVCLAFILFLIFSFITSLKKKKI